MDGFITVTEHWIDESGNDGTKWELRNAIFAFTKLNNAHHGKRLGQVLYKVTEHLAITESVSLSAFLSALYSNVFRSVSSLATTRKITEQCCVSLPHYSKEHIKECGIPRTSASSKCIFTIVPANSELRH